jgi:hypothetical protein
MLTVNTIESGAPPLVGETASQLASGGCACTCQLIGAVPVFVNANAWGGGFGPPTAPEKTKNVGETAIVCATAGVAVANAGTAMKSRTTGRWSMKAFAIVDREG